MDSTREISADGAPGGGEHHARERSDVLSRVMHRMNRARVTDRGDTVLVIRSSGRRSILHEISRMMNRAV